MLYETPRLTVHRAGSHRPANTASIRVLEKCGLRFVKYVPQADRNLYRITRPEWTARSQPDSP